MKVWIVILKFFAYIWLIAGGLIITIGIVGVWIKEGFTGVQHLLSPFNVINWIVTIIMLVPGLSLLMLANKLQERQKMLP